MSWKISSSDSANINEGLSANAIIFEFVGIGVTINSGVARKFNPIAIAQLDKPINRLNVITHCS